MGRIRKIALVLATAGLLGFAGSGVAQTVDDGTTIPDTTPPTTTPLGPTTPGTGTTDDTIRLPRNNARSGSVAARRPGLWTAAGLGKASEAQTRSLKAFGGVTYTATAEQSVRNQVLIASLEALFDTLDTVIQQIGLLGLLGGTTTQPSVPVN